MRAALFAFMHTENAMGNALPWAQVGMVLGGMLVGIVAGAIWFAKHLAKDDRKKKARDTGEHGAVVRREEYSLELAALRLQLDETAVQAREARAAAHAATTALHTIGQMIETSMRSLGDRLEGALRDVKDRVDGHDEEITDHHGRLRSVETQLDMRQRGL